MNLTHSAAKIVQQALINRAIGIAPGTNGNWPIYVSNLPDSPDNLIVCSRGVDRFDGRTQPDGEIQVHHAVQIRIRAQDEETANVKMKAILDVLDNKDNSGFYHEVVTIAGTLPVVYCIHSTSRIPLLIGPFSEPGVSKRQVVFINALAHIVQL